VQELEYRQMSAGVRTRKLESEKAKKQLYYYIIDHPNLTVYELSKYKQWSKGKVENLVRQLEEEGKITRESKIEKGRNKLLIRAVTPEEMIDWTVPNGLEDE